MIVWLAYAPPVHAPGEGEVPTTTPEERYYGDRAFLEAAPGTGDVSDAYAMITGRRLFTGDPQNRLEAAFWTALPFAAGGIKSLRGVDDAARATGQWHHILSNKIMRALGESEKLQDVFKRNDFLVQAFDKMSHWGYQTWHRLCDNEVVEWLAKNPEATQEEFLEYLIEIYERPEMKKRFPKAVEVLLEASEASKEGK